jgi:hypothetical protein
MADKREVTFGAKVKPEIDTRAFTNAIAEVKQLEAAIDNATKAAKRLFSDQNTSYKSVSAIKEGLLNHTRNQYVLGGKEDPSELLKALSSVYNAPNVTSKEKTKIMSEAARLISNHAKQFEAELTKAASDAIAMTLGQARTAYIRSGKSETGPLVSALRNQSNNPSATVRERVSAMQELARVEAQTDRDKAARQKQIDQEASDRDAIRFREWQNQQMAKKRALDTAASDLKEGKKRHAQETVYVNKRSGELENERQQMTSRAASRMWNKGELNDAEYKAFLIDKLSRTKEFSKEYIKVWENIDKVERHIAVGKFNDVANRIMPNGSPLNPNHSPVLSLMERFMSPRARNQAIMASGNALSSFGAGANWASMGMGFSPVQMVQQGIESFAEHQEARMRGDQISKAALEDSVSRGRITPQEQAKKLREMAAVNRWIDSAASGKLSLKDGVVSLNKYKEELYKNDVAPGDMLPAIEAMARYQKMNKDIDPENLATTTSKAINSMANVIKRDAVRKNPSLAGVNNIFDSRIGAIPDYLNKVHYAAAHSAANENDVFKMSGRLSGAGGTAGMSMDDIIALAASFASVGVTAEVGGSSLNKYIQRLHGASYSYDPKRGGGNEHLSTISKIMYGTNSGAAGQKKFADAFAESPGKAVFEFTARLQELEKQGAPVDQLLQKLDLGGDRVSMSLGRAGNSIQKFSDVIDGLKTSGNSMDALRKATEGLFGSAQSKMDGFTTRLKLLGEKFIASLGGDLEKVLGHFEKFLSYVASTIHFIEKLPTPVKEAAIGIVAFVFQARMLAAVLGPVVRAVGAFDIAWTAIKSKQFVDTVLVPMMTGMSGVSAEAVRATPTVTRLAGALGEGGVATAAGTATGKMGGFMAMLANGAKAGGPIAIAIAAIAALGFELNALNNIRLETNRLNDAAKAQDAALPEIMKIKNAIPYLQDRARYRDSIKGNYDVTTNPPNAQESEALKLAGLHDFSTGDEIRAGITKLQATKAQAEKQFKRQNETRNSGDADNKFTRSLYEAASQVDLGGKTIKNGCALFVSTALKKANLLDDTIMVAKDLDKKLMSKGGQRINLGAKGENIDQAKPGDVIFFEGPGFGGIKTKLSSGKSVGYHTGIYMGGGMVRHNSSARGKVATMPLSSLMQKSQTGMWAVRMSPEGMASGGGPSESAEDLLRYMNDPENNLSGAEKRKRLADPALADFATAKSKENAFNKEIDILLGRISNGASIPKERLVSLANNALSAQSQQDTAKLRAAKILGTNDEGAILNPEMLAAMPANQKRDRQIAYEQMIAKIDEAYYQARVKRLNEEIKGLEYQKRSLDANKSELDARLGMSVSVEEQFEIKRKMLDIERKMLTNWHQIEARRLDTIKDKTERQKAFSAMDEEYNSREAIIGFSGQGMARSALSAKYQQAESVSNAGAWRDRTSAAVAMRKKNSLYGQIYMSQMSEMLGLGATLDKSQVAALLEEARGIDFAESKSSRERRMAVSDLGVSLSDNPDEAYERLVKSNRTHRSFIKKYNPDDLQSFNIQAKESERKARLEREMYRMQYSPGDDSGYYRAMLDARGMAEKANISGAYQSSITSSFQYGMMGSSTPAAMASELKQSLQKLGVVMSDSEGRGDRASWASSAQAAAQLVSGFAQSAYGSLDRLRGDSSKLAGANAINDLINSIPEWQKLPEELRLGLTKSLTDSFNNARMQYDPAYRGRIEARRQLENGVSGAGERLGSDLISSGLKIRGTTTKAAVKQFWDTILGQGADSLAHVAWTNVLKPEFTKMFDVLKAQMGEIWKAGQVSWGQMISLSMSAMYLSGQQGKKGKKGATWGGLLGAGLAYATGGASALMMGATVGSAAGGAYASGGGIGGGLAAGLMSYGAQKYGGGLMPGSGKDAGTPPANDTPLGAGTTAKSGTAAKNRSVVNNNITINAGDNQTADYASQRVQERTYRALHMGR